MNLGEDSGSAAAHDNKVWERSSAICVLVLKRDVVVVISKVNFCELGAPRSSLIG